MSSSGREYDLKTKYACLFEEAMQLGDLPRCQDRLEKLVSEGPYLVHGGSYDTFNFHNTCVLDSLLAGIHILDIQFEELETFFSMDQTIRAVLRFMHHGSYNKAKALWLINLSLRSGDNHHFDDNFVDIRGYVRDHMPNFSDLSCATFYFDEERFSPKSEDRLMDITRKAFEDYGDVKLLGRDRAQLVLVHIDGRMETLPPDSIMDACGRTYRLQFLLLGDITPAYNHMLLYIKLIGQWMIFDAGVNPGFHAADWHDIEMCYVAFLAVYITKEHQE